MARPKLPGFPRHLHVDPYIRVKHEDHSLSYEEDARLDKFLKWYDSIPSGDRTQLCLDLIIAAVNGELGIAPAADMSDEDATLNKSALADLLKNMVMDEE